MTIDALDGEVVTGAKAYVAGKAHPFASERETWSVPAGETIAEIVDGPGGIRDRVPGFVRDHLVVQIGCELILPEDWDRRALAPGETLYFWPRPGDGVFSGSSGIVRVITQIAVVAAAAAIAPVIAGPAIAALGLGFAAGGLLTSGIFAGLVSAGSFAANALFPAAPSQLAQAPSSSIAGVAQISQQSEAASAFERTPVNAIGGSRNQMKPWGVIPAILGKIRCSPYLAAPPYTEQVGDDQYLRLLFCWGRRHEGIVISDMKIGETPLENYSGVSWGHSTVFYARQAYEQSLAFTFENANQNITLTTADDIDEILVDLLAADGLYQYSAINRNYIAYSIVFQASWRAAGTADPFVSTFMTVNGTPVDNQFANIAGSGPEPRRFTLRIDPPSRGKYEVKLIRITGKLAPTDNVPAVGQNVTLIAIRGLRNEAPIDGDVFAVTSMRILASGQLNGVVETFNGIASSQVTAWNGSAWVAAQESRNPGDLARAVLQHVDNVNRLTDAEIDLASFQGFASFCTTNGYEFNQYRDFSASVSETVRDILAAGRGTLAYKDGSFGVVWEDTSATAVQHFTPRNSWDFEGSKIFLEEVHALKCRFQNEDNNYLQDERIVYNDGYDGATATKIETIEFPGVTDPDLIYRHARYRMAELSLRPEVYTVSTNWEAMLLERGDVVKLSHDAALTGLLYARVKSTDAGAGTVTMDDEVLLESDVSYLMDFRLDDGTFLVRNLVAGQSGFLSTFELDPNDADTSLPAVGILGTLSPLTTAEYKVLDIEPQEDFTYRLTMVDKAAGIDDADTGPIPDFVSSITIPPDPFTLKPQNLVVVEAFTTVSSSVVARVLVDWTYPTFGHVAGFTVEVTNLTTGFVDPLVFVAAPASQAEFFNLGAGTFRFQVRTVFSDNSTSEWANSGSVQLEGDQAPPPDVTGFVAATAGSTTTLSWDPVNTDLYPNFSHYEVRFTPATSGGNWSGSQVIAANVQSNSTTVPTLAGTYSVKAVTFQGVQSENAVFIVRAGDQIVGFNAIETITESPAFDGDKSDVILSSNGTLVLVSSGKFFDRPLFFDTPSFFMLDSGFVSSGTYTFAQTIDLGAVITARVSANMTANGQDVSVKLFDRPLFFDIGKFFGSADGQWDATVQHRYTSDDPAGSPTWTSWANLVVGDVSARAHQFRVILESFASTVTPVITALSASVDAPGSSVYSGRRADPGCRQDDRHLAGVPGGTGIRRSGSGRPGRRVLRHHQQGPELV